MPLAFKKNRAFLDGTIGVEDAEVLLQWLLKTPKALINFSNCTHLHASNLQVMMAAEISVETWPKDEDLKSWLKAAFGR
jgi:hypothetical protein